MEQNQTPFHFSLQHRLITLIVLSVVVVVGVGAWAFQSLEAVEETAASQRKTLIEYSEERENILDDLSKRHRLLTELRKTNISDAQDALVVKIKGFNNGLNDDVETLLSRDWPGRTPVTAGLLSDLRRNHAYYNEGVQLFIDSSDVKPEAADRLLALTLNPAYLELNETVQTLYKNQSEAAGAELAALHKRVESRKFWGLTLMLIGLGLLVALPILLFGRPIRFLRRIIDALNKLKRGEISSEALPVTAGEAGEIAAGVNSVSQRVGEAAAFASDVGQGKFDTQFSAAGEGDVLGEALVEMRDRLRAVSEEEKRRNWAVAGFAKFGEILRSNEDLQTFADQIISNLTKYIEAIQGGFFVSEEDEETGKTSLKLVSAYAYERKKYIDREFAIGEGLVGQAAQEMATIYITEAPQDYVKVTSGLGDANPNCLLVVPLIANGELYGALEFAGFNTFEPYVVEFVERLAENIASTLTNVRNNERTVKLLQETQSMAEQLQANESEMRNNLQKLEAAQQEMGEVQIELEGQINAINNAAIVSEADLEGNIIFANDEFCRVSEYKREELIGKNHRIVKSGDQPDELFEDLWASISQGKVWKGLIKNRTKSGGFYWVNATISPVMGADNKPVKYIGVRFEITEQKLQEEKIQQQLERVSASEQEVRAKQQEVEKAQGEMQRLNLEMEGQLNAINRSTAVVQFDLDGKILSANENFQAIMGYEADEIIGQNHSMFLLPEEISGNEYQLFWKRLKRGAFKMGVFKRQAKDGSIVYLRGSYNPILGDDGKPIKILKFANDITAGKREEVRMKEILEQSQAQEEELRQNAEEMQSTQEEMQRLNREMEGQINSLNNAAIVSEADVQGNITFVNDEFCRISQYEREELIGQNHRILKSGHQPDELFEDLWATISQGKVWKGVVKNKKKHEGYYWVATTITPILDAEGKPYKYVGVRFDITEQKEQEQRIVQSMEEAQAQEEEIRQNAEELQSTHEEMQRLNIEMEGQLNSLNNAAIVSEADVQGNITFVNDEFCRISQYEREELIGQNHRILKSGHQPQELFDDLWATISAGKVWKGVVKNKKKHEGYYWVATTITPILDGDGKPYKYVGVRFDITEQKEQEQRITQAMEEAQAQEEEIRQNAEELQSTHEEMQRLNIEMEGQLNSLNNAAIVSEADLQGNITFVNDEFCRISQFEREELIGQNHRILKSGHQPQELFDDLWSTISQGKVWKGVVKNKKKHEGYYWVATTITPILDAEGKPYKYVGVRFDITAQKEQEQRIKQAMEEAQAQEEEIRQNAEELQATHEEMTRVNLQIEGQMKAINRSNAVIQFDPQGNILDANQNFLQVMGYELGEIQGQHHRIFVFDEDAQSEEYAALWEKLRNGEFESAVFRRKDKNGKTIWLRGSYNPILDGDGRVYKIMKFAADVTEQREKDEQIRQMLEESQAQEEELRQNAEELESTQEEMQRLNIEMQGQISSLNNSAIVSEADIQGNITFVNDEFCRISQYEREELIGQNHRILKSGHQPDELFDDLWATISAGKVWKGVVKNKKKREGYYWVATTITPILDADGKPYKYVGVRFDITEQKEQEQRVTQAMEEAQAQEEEIRQNAEELQATHEEMSRISAQMEGQLKAINRSNAVIEFDPDGHILDANRNFLKVMGYELEEIQGKHHRIFVYPEEAKSDEYEEFWAKLKEGAYENGVFKRMDKDGNTVWLRGSYNPILDADGKPYKIMKFAADITKAKQQEEELRQILEETQAQEEEIRQNAEELQASHEEMQRVQLELQGQLGALNNAAIVSETDLAGNITYVNKEFIRIAKYPEEELIGQNHRMLKSGHQPDEIFLDLWATISQGRVWQGVIKNKAKDGSYYWVSTTITPVIGQDNKPYKYVGVRFDITAQKEQEEKINQALEETQAQEEELRQNAEELQATQEEMRRLNLELDNQLASINRSTAVIEFDLNGFVLNANQNFCELSGYELDELRGKHHSAVVPDEESTTPEYAQFWKTLRNGEFVRGEFKRVNKQGEPFYVLGSYNPVKDAEGKPYKIIAFKIDVTRHKAAELKVRESEARFNKIANNVDGALFQFKMEASGEYGFTYASDKVTEVLGYEPQEFYADFGQNKLLKFSDEESARAFEESLRVSFRKLEPWAWEGRMKDFYGEERWIEISGKPERNSSDRSVAWDGYLRDVTERKQAEKELARALEQVQASEEELRQNAEEMEATNEELRRAEIELSGQVGALNNAALVSETDLQGNITYVNDEFCRVAKYAREELLGKNHRILKSGHQPQEIFDDLWATISSGRVWHGLIKNKAKDGTFYWVKSTIYPVKGEENKPLKYIGVRFEVSEQIEQQEEMKNALHELEAQEEEIRQNAEEMEATNEELRRVQTELKGQVGALNHAALVSETNIQGEITYVNDEFCRIAKYEREELLGKNHRILKSGHQPQELFDDLWSTISSGRTWYGVIKNRAQDGSYYWVKSTITPVLDEQGKPIKYIGVRFEITRQIEQQNKIQHSLEELRAQEEEIRQNAEELEASREEVARMNVEYEGRLSAIDRSSAVAEFNMDGEFLNANDNFLEMTGYSWAELEGRKHALLLPEGEADAQAYRIFWEKLRKGIYEKGEFERVNKSGERFWVLGSYNPILDRNGKPYKVLKIAQNITLEKMQENELRQTLEEAQAQEEELRQNLDQLEHIREELAFQSQVTKNVPVGVLVYDFRQDNGSSDYVLREINDAALRLFGFGEQARSAYIGQKVSQVFENGRTETNKKIFDETLQSRRPRAFEETLKSGNGEADRVVAVQVFPLKDDKVGVTYEDVTDRARSERQLALAEKELNSFFTHSADMLCVNAEDGKFKRVNPAMERSAGYAAAELLDTPFAEIVHIDDRAKLEAAFGQLKAGAEVANFEIRLRCKDGTNLATDWAAVYEPETGLIYAVGRRPAPSNLPVNGNGADGEAARRVRELEGQLEAAKRLTGYIELSAYGFISGANDRMLRQLGYEKADLENKHLSFILQKMSQDTLEEIIDRVEEDHTVEREIILVSKDQRHMKLDAVFNKGKSPDGIERTIAVFVNLKSE